jgi:hypothetical protein
VTVRLTGRRISRKGRDLEAGRVEAGDQGYKL